MIGKSVNSEEAKYIIETKKNSKNIYSKIAPPNTFKMRTSNQLSKKPKIFQRYEKTPQSNQISNPYINYNSNFAKRSSFISNNTAFISNVDSNIKLSQNINSSFREKIKIIKGNLFSNQNNIVSPKKLIMGKMKVNVNNTNNNNRPENNKIKMPVQIFVKNKSVYIKKDRNNILKSFKENTTSNYEDKKKKEIKNSQIIKEVKNEINYNNIDNDLIKEKYDELLEKTKNLLLNYQKIVEYYQEKEKNNTSKIEDNS
jgi:hypothetical protein